MYDGTDTVPLFGDARPRDKYLNYFIGGFTSALVTFTFISSLIPWEPQFRNVLLAAAIILACAGELVLIFWYRRGDLDPKFRKLIYYNCFTVIVLCIAANMFYYPKK